MNFTVFLIILGACGVVAIVLTIFTADDVNHD
jgi:hypothetical protein